MLDYRLPFHVINKDKTVGTYKSQFNAVQQAKQIRKEGGYPFVYKYNENGSKLTTIWKWHDYE